jgi:hypothetical protein
MFIKEVAILVGLTLFDWYCKATREINFLARRVVPCFIPTENYAYFFNGKNVTSTVNVYFSLDSNPTCGGLLACLGKGSVLTVVEQTTWDVMEMSTAATPNYVKNTINMININLLTKKYIKHDGTESPVMFGRLDLTAILGQMESVHELNTNLLGTIINTKDYPAAIPVYNDENSDDELDALAAQLH